VQKHLGHASAEITRRYQRKRDRFEVNLGASRTVWRRLDRGASRNLGALHHPARLRSRAALPALPRNSAISTGPSENSPALALAVSTRK
jgi:hypothetical protein